MEAVMSEPEKQRDGIDMHLSPTRLMLLLSLLLGGVVGGGGMTLARAPDPIPSSLAGDVAALKVSTEKLNEKMEGINVTLAKIEGSLSKQADDAHRLREDVADHEKRIRELERRLSR